MPFWQGLAEDDFGKLPSIVRAALNEARVNAFVQRNREEHSRLVAMRDAQPQHPPAAIRVEEARKPCQLVSFWAEDLRVEPDRGTAGRSDMGSSPRCN